MAAARFRKGVGTVRSLRFSLQVAIAHATGRRSWTVGPERSRQQGCAFQSPLRGTGDAVNPEIRMRTVFFPPPARWRRPSSEGAGCCRRKPGRCWGELRASPGNSGPRLARCCSRDAFVGTGEEGAQGVAFPGPRCPLCTPPWARVRRPLCPLRDHSLLSGSGAPAAARAVSRRRGSAPAASALLAAGRTCGR